MALVIARTGRVRRCSLAILVLVHPIACAAATGAGASTISLLQVSGLELEVSGPPVAPGRAAHVLLTTDRRLGRPTEVVAVIELDTAAPSEDEGLAELRARAAAMGADAVVGLQFEPAYVGGRAHLSGLAVRFR